MVTVEQAVTLTSQAGRVEHSNVAWRHDNVVVRLNAAWRRTYRSRYARSALYSRGLALRGPERSSVAAPT